LSSVLIQLGEVKKTHKEGRVFGSNLINKAAANTVEEKAKELYEKHKFGEKTSNLGNTAVHKVVKVMVNTALYSIN
jgi:hypothetical protein